MKNMMILAMLGAIAVGFSSCAPTTPAARIERSPEIYQSLPQQHQEAVGQGRLLRGMNHDAVYLAWGWPSSRAEIVDSRGGSERWDYVGTRPEVYHHFYGSYGYGSYNRYGRYSRASIGMMPEVAYVPYHKASVWFQNGKVDSWESVQ